MPSALTGGGPGCAARLAGARLGGWPGDAVRSRRQHKREGRCAQGARISPHPPTLHGGVRAAAGTPAVPTPSCFKKRLVLVQNLTLHSLPTRRGAYKLLQAHPRRAFYSGDLGSTLQARDMPAGPQSQQLVCPHCVHLDDEMCGACQQTGTQACGAHPLPSLPLPFSTPPPPPVRPATSDAQAATTPRCACASTP